MCVIDCSDCLGKQNKSVWHTPDANVAAIGAMLPRSHSPSLHPHTAFISKEQTEMFLLPCHQGQQGPGTDPPCPKFFILDPSPFPQLDHATVSACRSGRKPLHRTILSQAWASRTSSTKSVLTANPGFGQCWLARRCDLASRAHTVIPKPGKLECLEAESLFGDE